MPLLELLNLSHIPHVLEAWGEFDSAHKPFLHVRTDLLLEPNQPDYDSNKLHELRCALGDAMREHSYTEVVIHRESHVRPSIL